MRSYAFTVISHIVGIVLSTGLLFYCVHEEIIFCPTFCGIAILYFSIHLYFIQMRQVKYWRYVVDCLRQQDLIQIVRDAGVGGRFVRSPAILAWPIDGRGGEAAVF